MSDIDRDRWLLQQADALASRNLRRAEVAERECARLRGELNTVLSVSEAQRDAVRHVLLKAISEESEERWAAGWNSGCEWIFWREGGHWRLVGELVGWPCGYDAERGWLTAEQANEYAARYFAGGYKEVR